MLQLVGEEIVVEDYLIPLTGKRAQSHYVFSAHPVNRCFICGKAGQESLRQVFMQDA